jgi:capsular polysaccharide transport system permease protein
MLSKPEADIVYGFPTIFSGSTKEALYQHYSQFIDVAYASSTGITTLKVRAFTPHDAQAIATALLRHAERVVNQLNERAQTDSIQFAVDMAAQAEKRVVSAQMKLAQFRNRTSVIDPDKQSDAILSLVETLSKEKSSLETALLETTSATPSSPRIPALRNRITALDQQILEYNQSLAGGAESMASRKAEYDRLELERELASKSLTAALSTLERARQDVARQQLYLQRVVQPNLPDKSQYPSRVSAILMVAAICLAVYWIVKSLADVILAHDA